MKIPAGPKRDKQWSSREIVDSVRAAFAEDPAQAAVDFFADYLVHIRGPLAGCPFVLEPWQEVDVRKLFGTMDEDGLRQYQTWTLGVPRKNGKSTLAAGLAIMGLFLEDGAQVILGANDRKQAGIVFNTAREMIDASPELDGALHLYAHYIELAFTNSTIVPLAAEAHTALGLHPSMVVMDEFSFFSKRGEDFYRALSSAQGAREQPIFLEISTASEMNPESFGYRRWMYARQVLEGVVEDDTHMVTLYEAGLDEAWDDEETWKRVNPNWGVSVQPKFLRRELRKAKESIIEQNAFRMFYTNAWVTAAKAWIDVQTWLDGGEEPELRPGAVCYGGIDLGSTNDLTALALVFPRPDGMRDVLMKYYVPEAKLRKHSDNVSYRAWEQEGLLTVTPGNATDYAFIRRDVNELHELYNLKEVAIDRWNATQISIQLAEEDGIEMVAFGQGYASMSPAVKSTERFALEQRIRHGRHPILAWNVSNAVPEMDAAGNVKLNKAKSTGRIDGLIALVMAMARADANDYDQRSVYEGRGLLTL